MVHIINQFLTAVYIKLFRLLPVISTANKQVDPQIDNKEPFSFFARPNMQLGVPNQHHATQVTPEGRLYTGAAEFVFFINKKLVNTRIWTLKDGYLPLLCYDVVRNNVVYSFEIFQFWLDNDSKTVPINYVNLKIRNTSSGQTSVSVAVGFKFCAKDHRASSKISGGMQQMSFKKWVYEFNEDTAVRDKKVMYITSRKPDQRWRDVKRVYREKFRTGSKSEIVLISEFSFNLAPQQEESVIIKIPYYPIDCSPKKNLKTERPDIDNDTKTILENLRSKSWSDAVSEFEHYWKGLIDKGSRIEIMEKKVADTSKTNLIFNFMTQDYDKNVIIQKVNRFQYNDFWIRDSSFYIRMYCMFGFFDTAKGIIRNILRYQRKNGNFLSQGGQLDGFGQSLWSFSEYVKFSNDLKFGQSLVPFIDKAINWFEHIINHDKFGILPPTSAFDNESIIGRYTGQNVWALIGLKSTTELLQKLGLNDKARTIQNLYNAFYHNFINQLRKNLASERVVPPGLDVRGGIDWGNLLLIYPKKIFNPHSKIVQNTFLNYYNRKMAEGLATWMGYLHHYLTERIAQSFLIMGDKEKTIRCFYAMLVHTGSCNEGFEMAIWPWGNRDYKMGASIINFYNFPPHGWFGVCYNTLLRNMLLREDDAVLHIIPAIPFEWVKPGKELNISQARSYFGSVNLSIKGKENGCTIEFNADFSHSPKIITVHSPHNIELTSARLNNSQIEVKPDLIVINSAKHFVLEVLWKRISDSELNYRVLLEEYKDEYRSRFFKRTSIKNDESLN